MDHPFDDPDTDEQTLNLKHLFFSRDDAYTTATQAIVDVIGPTVLEALYELFQVPVEQVKWIDFQSTENLLIVICAIQYDPSSGTSRFIQSIRDQTTPSNGVVTQTLRLGIPLQLVLSSPEAILNFMLALADSHKEGGPTLIQETTVSAEYIEQEQSEEQRSVRLTPEQTQQMLMFQHQSRGKVH